LSGGWAKRAADLGWDTLALFGCHPTRPLGHFNGLLWRISGGKITAMQSDWQRSRSTGSGASTCPTKFWWGSLLGAMVRDRIGHFNDDALWPVMMGRQRPCAAPLRIR
jgi:hypothetical protein